MGKKTGFIWSVPKLDLEKIVSQAKTFAEIIRYYDMASASSSYRMLRAKLDFDNINYSHIPQGKDAGKGRFLGNKREFPLEIVLVENSTYTRSGLKSRLIKNGLLENKCNNCGLPPIWDNKKLVLVLDHINGINNDNRIENLRLLCPNCNSQTSTFSGRNVKCKKVKKSEIDPNWMHKPRPNTRKVERPSKEELEKLLWEMPSNKIGIKFGVSEKSIEKWAKKYGLNKPGRGYWQKKVVGKL